MCEPFQVIPYFSSLLPHLLASYHNMYGSQLTHLNQPCIGRALIFRIRPPDALSPNSDWSTFSSIQVVIVIYGKYILNTKCMHCWGLQFGICIDGFSNAFSRCVNIFHGVCFYEPNILITNQETCPPPSVPDPCLWHPNVSINLTVSICVAVVLLMFYCVRMATSTLVIVVVIASVLSGQSTYD